MKIVSHTDYKTTANIYTQLKKETLKHASVDPEGVFENKAKPKTPKGIKEARSRKPAVDNTLPWANQI